MTKTSRDYLACFVIFALAVAVGLYIDFVVYSGPVLATIAFAAGGFCLGAGYIIHRDRKERRVVI